MANIYKDTLAAGASTVLTGIGAGAVVSLIHTKQLSAEADASGAGDWVELYNGSAADARYSGELRVTGGRLRLTNLDADNANKVCADEV